MKNTFVILLLVLFAQRIQAQSLYFPPNTGLSWDTLSPASLGWCQPPLDSLLDYLEARETKAFLVLKDGKLVVEKYYGTFTRDSAWYWASAGKSLTSFLVGIAQQEGFLSINDTTSRIIGSGWTSCSTAQEDRITVRDQLCMTSGLDDAVPDKDCTDPACLQYLADAGTRWAYHNAPYTLLDTVIESATGQTLNSYLQQKVKSPTGMTGAFFKLGYNNVFFSTARSMARYGLLILNNGNWNGNQVMSDTAYFNQMVNTSQSLNLSYGYLWWLNGKTSFMLPSSQFVFPGSLSPSAPADMFAALGKNGQMLNIVPSQNLIWLRMGNEPNAGFVPNFFNDTIWQYLNQAMCNITAIPSDGPTAFTPNVFPVPASESLSIHWPGQFSVKAELMQVDGRVLDEFVISPGTTSRAVSSLPKGMYLMRFQLPDRTEVLKIMIE
ncbi:MAG: serine hydrolase [Bacteroidota bacterium]|jgi:CubicO group peptidase (beta-lactamase class C family)